MTDVIVKRADGSLDVGLRCDDPSLTKQSEAAACDINKIMAKYERSGLMTHLAENQPFYADVSAFPDYQAAHAIVERAHELFQSIPAEIRAKFDNDPAVYLAFVQNPANFDECVKLGFFQPKEVPAPAVPPPPKV